MNIVPIFALKLFAFHYENEVCNEYERCMDFWTDVNRLQSYAKRNNITDRYKFIENVLAFAEEIQDFLDQLDQDNIPLSSYFQVLDLSETKKILSLQKGKINRNILRLYALKIDNNCYIITGGAIKMSQKMEDHQDTKNELIKLEKARAYLNSKGVFNDSSFFEFINEDDDE